ncbi:Protein phosphatase 2C [Purpureocillium lavendulum]|uniref:Protein phosphatase 2C n=1 Tax=Purpureocillium lavendulum TaxID=1247861 RepID=A0AB34G3I9_9HYPO|nr:Protein phosphatase 2C [Purpureocillium lavendulum]
MTSSNMAGKQMLRVIVFGDQAVPFLSELGSLVARKDNHILAAFLAEAYRILRAEIGQLPLGIQSHFPAPSTLAELLAAHRAFIACAQNIVDILTIGPQIVALAFKIGLLVETRTSSLISTPPSRSSSYSVVVGGIDKETASSLVNTYCDKYHLSALSRLYISAVGHDNVTVSGPEEQLRHFCSQHSTLRSAKVAVRGLFHSPHLYALSETDAEVDKIADHIKAKVPRMAVLSNSNGQAFTFTSCEGLLKAAVWEIVSKELRWDLVTDSASSVVKDAGALQAAVLPFASGSLASFVAALSGPGDKKVQVVNTAAASVPESKRSKIAIIGFSGRYPEADNNDEFWDLLFAGLDVVKEIPKSRFDPWLYYDPTGKKKNTSGVTKGCFVKTPWMFDARFFGLSPREAEQADPAQRLAMMTAYEAMEMAGFVPDATPSSRRDRVGVFYGTASDDYRECNSGQDVDTYFVPGGSRAFLPARINYQWRFSGPSFDVDTACSSSLAAIHLACTSLWQRDCDTAIAGGTNILTNPDNWAGLDRAHFLSRTGNCNTFDDGADGYCRSEAVATILMKRLEDAEMDGDPIFGTILGAYTNHSAEAVSMTRPHSGAQRAIFSRIMTGAGVDSNDVSYVEMHGTGTQHGDACEMDSVLSVFNPEPGVRRKQSLHLGSTKANIGHAESASGVSSLIKVLMMMEKNVIPPHVGIKTRINRNFPTDLTERNVHIALKPASWPRPTTTTYGRRAFVNNFGAAGGNSSVLLEDAPLEKVTVGDSRPLHMVAVSAKSQTALKDNLRVLREYLDTHPDTSLPSLSYTTTARRMQYGFRSMVSGASIDDIRLALKAAETKEGYLSTASANPTAAFCFTGQGSQYFGMGRQLLDIPQFRSIVLGLDDILSIQGFQSIVPILSGTCDIAMEDISPQVLQLSITCLEMALGKFWKMLGIVPSAVIGHSLGEYAALNIAGVLSDAETIHLVGTRAALLKKHCAMGTHAMLAIKATLEQVESLIESLPGLEIACINGPSETVVAGTNVDVATLSESLARLGVKGTTLKVQFAFHSAQVDSMLDSYRQACKSVTFKDPTIPVLSSSMGKVLTTASDFGTPAEYLASHCRQPVKFAEAVLAGSQEGIVSEKTIWVEVGPHPICSNMVKNTLGPKARAFPSLRRGEDDWKVLVSTLTSLYECGLSINWSEYHSGFRSSVRVIRLPAYQWELKEFWIQYRHDWCLTKGDPPALPQPSISAVAEEPEKIFTASVQRIVEEKHSATESRITARSNVKYPDLLAILQGHRINGRPMCPSSTYADMALTLFTRLLDNSGLQDKADICVGVCNMAADKTLLLTSDALQLIELKAVADWSSKTATFTLCSVTADGKVTATNARCTGTFSSRSKTTTELKRRDFLVKSRIDHLQHAVHRDDESVHLLKPGMFYKLFASIVEYDGPFRGIREVIMNSSGLECTARVKFNTAPGEGDKWGCAPYWIESLGQITGFSLNGNDALDCQNFVFINHGWSCVRFLKQLSPDETYRTYVKMETDDGETYSGDLYLFDSKMEIAGIYEGVTFKALSRKVFEKVVPRPGAVASSKVEEKAPRDISRTISVETPVESFGSPDTTEAKAPAASDVPAKIRSLLADEVGVAIHELKDDDDLVALGVDSLLALTISDRIQEELGATIDSTAFLDSITVQEVIERITGTSTPSIEESSAPTTPPSSSDSLDGCDDADASPMSSAGGSEVIKIVEEKPAGPAIKATSVLLQGYPTTATKNLWLVADGSGLATSYLALPDVDTRNVAVYGLNSPFVKRTEGMSEYSFGDLVASYIVEIRRRQPHGPYYLGGWSAGGTCAFLAAQRLIDEGETVERLILIDSPNPIGLEKLPFRLFDDFNRLGVFGTSGRAPPEWLRHHFEGFNTMLHAYEPAPFRAARSGQAELKTWVVWATDGVSADGSIKIFPSDPPNVTWLLRTRTESVLGPNGWDQLVGRDNMTIERLHGAHHFNMLNEPSANGSAVFVDNEMAAAAKTGVAQTDRPLGTSSCCDSSRRASPKRWFHWYEPGTSKEEKWLLFKLDFFILTYTCLTFFVKYLDQTNITNAYISGMKEDLDLSRRGLNETEPQAKLGRKGLILILYWLPACTATWSVFVLCMYKATDVKTLYILRFFCGLAESGVMPGAWYIIGSWYRKSEIARRTALFYFSAIGGLMLSGYIQAGLYHNMNNRLGLAAWRWLFIFDFIISIPIAVLGFFVCPDEPKARRMWWMTEDERQRCIQRLAEEDRDSEPVRWNWASFRQLFKCWQLYGFCIAWGTLELTCAVNLQRWMGLWLKSLKENGHPKYSIEQINALPTVIGCLQLVWMLLSSFTADYLQNASVVIAALAGVQLIGYIIFSVWPDSESAIMAAFYVTSAYGAIGPLLGSWLNSCSGGDKILRALSSALMSSVGL